MMKSGDYRSQLEKVGKNRKHTKFREMIGMLYHGIGLAEKMPPKRLCAIAIDRIQSKLVL